MIETTRYVTLKAPHTSLFILLWIFLSCGVLSAQEGAVLGNISPPNSSNISSQYRYNADTDRYIFTEEIGGYPISIPLMLSVKEYEALVLKEQMKTYFQDKLQVLSGRGSNLEEIQKNLLPELYVNNKFFQSIFGSDAINISPQGSIGIDLGYRYQKMIIQMHHL